jgi:REase_AHJR-like
MNREEAIAQVADKYRGEGYRVVKHPGAEEALSFINGHSVDLVAYKGDEKVVVQVKETTEDLRNDPEAIPLAELVNAQPGWRFDLVVLNPDGPSYKVSADAVEPPLETIEQTLASAEKMSSASELPLACVLSWAALEAAMRRAARLARMEIKATAPSFLLRTLYSEGLLHRSEFDQLNDAMKIRNAIAHGLLMPAIDPTVPQYIVTVARRLLSTNGRK